MGGYIITIESNTRSVSFVPEIWTERRQHQHYKKLIEGEYEHACTPYGIVLYRAGEHKDEQTNKYASCLAQKTIRGKAVLIPKQNSEKQQVDMLMMLLPQICKQHKKLLFK